MSLDNEFKDEFDKQCADVTKANLMVVGGTGVGKSSLINLVFGKKLAKTGAGKPITRGCNRYESENIPVVIFDTEGYEIVNDKQDNSNFKREIIAEIARREQLDLKDQIHLYWYCISASNHRITDYDIDNIKNLNSRPSKLGIVITQCDNEEVSEDDEGLTSIAFRKVLKDAGIQNEVFETSTTLEEKLQLDDLLNWSATSLSSDELKDAFIGAQQKNITLKDKQSDQAIWAAVIAAGGAAGVNPFPMSDSLALTPIQMALAARLAQIYGFNALGANALALLKTQVLSLVGKQMAASLTKLIPVLGAVINATVAAGITKGFGNAMKYTYRTAYLEVLETGGLPDWVKLFSNLNISKYITENSKI